MRLSTTATFLVLLLAVVPAGAQQQQPYTNGELLKPCVEGSNDARDGLEILAVCDQYILGFMDTVDWLASAGGSNSIAFCLPAASDRLGALRRAFIRWATHQQDKHHEPAVTGLIATLREHFPCGSES